MRILNAGHVDVAWQAFHGLKKRVWLRQIADTF